MTEFKEIICKSALSKSNLDSFDYAINPYVGCMHNCLYCYAQYMRKFTNHPEEWGTFVDAKVNVHEILQCELSKIKSNSKILLSSVTDCYQEIEKKYKLTRKTLEILTEFDFDITILTKSKLILRDIDLLKKLKCNVGFSINTVEDKYRSLIEPGASSVEERIESLEFLKNNGINTFVFVAPIIPYITEFEKIFSNIDGKINYLMGECININNENWEKLFSITKNILPCDEMKFKAMIKSKTIWDKAEEKFLSLCKEYGIECKGFFRHNYK